MTTLARAEVSAGTPAALSGEVGLWRRFSRHRAAVAGLVLAGAMALACLVSVPLALSQEQGQPAYDRQRAGPLLGEPTGEHVLGTDALGRDLLIRLGLGGAISLGIGLAAALLAGTIGVTWGMVAGYAGGRVDAVLMRIVDVLYGLPYVLLVILLKVAFEKPLAAAVGSAQLGSILILLLAIGAVSWLTMARVVRGQVLSLKAQPFVEAARAAGASDGRILLREILPNLAGPVLVYATLIVPQAILQESFLSFLGIGVAPPVPTWGAMAAEGVSALNTIRVYWWLIVWPCLALGLTLLSLNFIGDGLRDALDPTGRTFGGRRA